MCERLYELNNNTNTGMTLITTATTYESSKVQSQGNCKEHKTELQDWVQSDLSPVTSGFKCWVIQPRGPFQCLYFFYQVPLLLGNTVTSLF